MVDYRIFNEEYWHSGTAEVKERRKATQQKLYELNESIETFASRNDLYPHYKKEHLTSGIFPSKYNFERVMGIWMRYGKHKLFWCLALCLKEKKKPIIYYI